jgi:hypothetical protein
LLCVAASVITTRNLHSKTLRARETQRSGMVVAQPGRGLVGLLLFGVLHFSLAYPTGELQGKGAA